MASNAGVFWIASYPRSGSTWTRFLLTAYFTGSAAGSGEVSAFAPDLHVLDTSRLDPPAGTRKFFKTHFVRTPSHPLIAHSRGAIVLLRNPRDVLLSCLALHKALGREEKAGGGSDLAYARAFIMAGGDPDWAQRGFGTWAEFNSSWLKDAGFPVLPVRYEDLLDSTARELTRVLAFVGEQPFAARVDAAVQACGFGMMRAIEQREKRAPDWRHSVFSGSPESFNRGHAFLAASRRQGTLEAIAPGLDAEFDRRFGPAR